MKLLLLLLLFSHHLHAGDTLFVDDFSSRELETSWIIYGDPLPRILDSLGLPPPCFNNNGDSMGGSGVISREIFEIGEGIVVKCNMYMSCSERGTWVTASISFVTPGFRDDRTPQNYPIASIDYSYSGELDWSAPNRQGVLDMHCTHDKDDKFSFHLYHQNTLLDGWHRYRMEIDEYRAVNYFIDDSLYCTSAVSIPDTIEHVRIQLGNRSSVWGIALHDNVVVYRP